MPTPTPSTRRAIDEDAPRIVALLAQLGYETPLDIVRRNIALSNAEGDDAAFVAVDENAQIVGCIGLHALTMFHLAGRLGRITALVVEENARGSGVGHALMAAAHAWFNEQGCEKFEVTSSDHRVAAHRFYARHGYARDGQRLARKSQTSSLT
ncbi:GNAT family N-acetyltransferase [Pandoraea commovens]|uniref:N-acetyltransferase n=1 Tax=Pandoraea commovens TaxID=2508289 RepID=A0A5E4YGN0_9BURK|nr:GNAT family N-acetyltransferase [Pandoraea commovens]UVA79104.1 GNAT family N-acetyltransferase [Pandoraea commovens]VVE47495.1 N-acetyltransferase [Pandoraea commovens]